MRQNSRQCLAPHASKAMNSGFITAEMAPIARGGWSIQEGLDRAADKEIEDDSEFAIRICFRSKVERGTGSRVSAFIRRLCLCPGAGIRRQRRQYQSPSYEGVEQKRILWGAGIDQQWGR